MKVVSRRNYLLGALVVLGIVIILFFQGSRTMYAHVNSITDLKALFPLSTNEIKRRVDESLAQLTQDLDALLAIADDQRSFANTAKKLDEMMSLSNAVVLLHTISLLEMVSPDEAIRNECHEQQIKMQDFFIEHVSNNVQLYRAFKAYAHDNALKEVLDNKQRYFIEETVKGFEHAGLGLPEGVRNEVKRVQKELAALCLQFDTNIAADETTLKVKEAELEGVTEDFKKSLTKEGDDYVLTMQAPTFIMIMENCSVAEIRKKMLRAYRNRAYPANDRLLKEIVAKRDELARLLDVPSYTAYDLEDQMVKNPARVREFLDQLFEPVMRKAAEEFKTLTTQLPHSVTLEPNGQLQPWHLAYVNNWYKKNYLSVDEQKVAEYFPAEKTIAGLLSIYEKFFSLQFKEHPIDGLWYDDLTLLEVFPQGSDQLLGYFILDLYPRPFKYSHACHATIIPSTIDIHGKPNVAVSLVIANFPRATADKPALFERTYVKTFFHEFGHALHALLGRTTLASFSGTSVKTDFVEMPSQMLEEWLQDKEILSMLSSHYQTGESLPDELIEKIMALRTSTAGMSLARQLFFAYLSLQLFEAGAQKDPYAMSIELSKKTRPFLVFDPEDHDYAAFGHLTGYGAKYYSYMWSNVFALDLFDTISQHGLLNPQIGARYVTQVIGQGGSVDPDKLLEDFLGRKPSQKAFLKHYGLQ